MPVSMDFYSNLLNRLVVLVVAILNQFYHLNVSENNLKKPNTGMDIAYDHLWSLL